MHSLHISLFSRLDLITPDGQPLALQNRKVEELLCFLLLNRDHPHSRERLAGLLWPDAPAHLGRSYLRKALWQLQRALSCQAGGVNNGPGGGSEWLIVSPEWVSVRAGDGLQLDVAEFETAYTSAIQVAGRDLPPEAAQALHQAVTLYRGDLLENWYCDWLLVDRERLQLGYIIMLEKLMSYSEAHNQLEIGLNYGLSILRLDPAHERVHRMLMRFYLLAGRPAAAAHQYELCAAVLQRELGVSPSQQTVDLYHQVQRGQPGTLPVSAAPTGQSEVWARLSALQAAIYQAENEIQALKDLML